MRKGENGHAVRGRSRQGRGLRQRPRVFTTAKSRERQFARAAKHVGLGKGKNGHAATRALAAGPRSASTRAPFHHREKSRAAVRTSCKARRVGEGQKGARGNAGARGGAAVRVNACAFSSPQKKGHGRHFARAAQRSRRGRGPRHRVRMFIPAKGPERQFARAAKHAEIRKGKKGHAVKRTLAAEPSTTEIRLSPYTHHV